MVLGIELRAPCMLGTCSTLCYNPIEIHLYRVSQCKLKEEGLKCSREIRKKSFFYVKHNFLNLFEEKMRNTPFNV